MLRALKKWAKSIWWCISLGCAVVAGPEANATDIALDAETRALADGLRMRAETWLEWNFRDKGLFVYQYDPATDTRSRRNNAIRQLMASLICARRAHHVPHWERIHRQNLDFIFAHWYREDAHGGYVYYNGKSKLGANGILLSCLSKSPHFETYRAQAAALARGILALQGLDGSFRPWYRAPDYKYDADRLLMFYAGEALLGLIHYYEQTREPALWQAILKSVAHYKQKYVDEIAQHYYPAYVPWFTMVFHKLDTIHGDTAHRQAIFTMNDRVLELQDHDTFIGRFYNPQTPQYGTPHAASDAVYLEGLAIAYRHALAAQDAARSARYRTAIHLGIRYLADLQHTAQNPAFYAAPAHRYLGGIPAHSGTTWIRVDNVQHAICAVDNLLDGYN